MNDLERLLSAERLAAYKRTPRDSERDCLRHYLYNQRVSEALYPTLHGLEVGLRNGIDTALRQQTGNAFWFDDPSIIADPRTRDIIASVKHKLHKEHKPITAGRIIAGLHFGFWRALFYAKYETLWRGIVKQVFAYAPKSKQQRRKLALGIDTANRLRNRVFHYEPIWQIGSLADDHRMMLEHIGWLSPTLRDLVEANNRFSEVYHQDIDDAIIDRLLEH